MLLSEKKKFIFIHIYKNAGTSIRTALMPYTSNWIYRNIDRVLTKLDISVPLFHGPLSRLKKHTGAQKIIEEMGRDRFDSYFSFAFCRNPWDWQVSQYTYMLSKEEHFQHKMITGFNGFDEYIEWRCKHEVILQKDFVYSADDELLVDFVGRYENLENDFNQICKKIGVEAALPKLNISNNKNYRDFYTEKTRELVREAFKEDIQLFQYEF